MPVYLLLLVPIRIQLYSALLHLDAVVMFAPIERLA
jgi:hypothetical protein